MLSRVAENIYWMARYIERAENTARLIGVNANLVLDLPKGIAPGWELLIAITGSDATFREYYNGYGERQVLRFLVGDRRNPAETRRPSYLRWSPLARTPALSATSFRARPGSRSTSCISTRRINCRPGLPSVAALSQEELHAFIDELQRGLGQLHDELARAYFLTALSTAVAS